MRVISADAKRAELSLEAKELLVVSNALNEVCNGLDMPDFQTRLGVDREYARALLVSIVPILDKMTLK